jgi:pimeloyl-ACP methyl ester carboxylesterase
VPWHTQVPFLPELVLRANGFEAMDAALRTGPGGVRTPGALTAADVDAYKREISRPGALTAAINYYRAAIDSIGAPPDPVLRAAMRRALGAPTLLLWAERDAALSPRLLRGVGKYVEDLEVHTLEGCSHWAQQDKPEEFNRLVGRFLERAERRGGGAAAAAAGSS